jgi:hypothetical protein
MLFLNFSFLSSSGFLCVEKRAKLAEGKKGGEQEKPPFPSSPGYIQSALIWSKTDGGMKVKWKTRASERRGCRKNGTDL